MHAAELAYHLRIVEGLSDRMLSRMPVWKNPNEDRYREVLREKVETIQHALEELKTNPLKSDNIIKYLKIIYREDETDMLLYEQWKRLAQQNKTVNDVTLKELESNVKRMRKELKKSVPYVMDIAGGWEKARFIVPAFYREEEKKGESRWTEEK